MSFLKAWKGDLRKSFPHSKGNAREVFVPDLETLLADVPEGEWVSISQDGKRILAHGLHFDDVHRAAPEGFFIRKSTGTFLYRQVG
jgi:hypothetical protein